MRIDLMREQIKQGYGPGWAKKVDRMPENQVIAIYLRMHRDRDKTKCKYNPPRKEACGYHCNTCGTTFMADNPDLEECRHCGSALYEEEIGGDTVNKNKVEERIYSSWAYTENEREKAAMNRKIYEQLKGKAVLERVGTGYGSAKYKVVENPHNLSVLELALIADRGNLCFGYRVEGDYIIIHTD